VLFTFTQCLSVSAGIALERPLPRFNLRGSLGLSRIKLLAQQSKNYFNAAHSSRDPKGFSPLERNIHNIDSTWMAFYLFKNTFSFANPLDIDGNAMDEFRKMFRKTS
jgi:hypothetical protein